MNFLAIFLWAGLTIWAWMTILWIISLLIRDASIVDIFWGAGFVISGWLYFLLTTEGFLARKLLLIALVTLWGLRLTIHIGTRNIGKGEDFRYKKWREEFGDRWWWLSYLRVFLLQGLLMWIISLPLLAAQYYPTPDRLTWLDWIAVIVWSIGFYFEAIGDFQLKRFKADPENRGKVLDRGVWRYTRHPNYFGDATQWWAFYLFALATISGWWTIISPLIMTYLLRFVSGVTMLDDSLKDKKPGYREYIETTNAFIPWFPKKKEN